MVVVTWKQRECQVQAGLLRTLQSWSKGDHKDILHYLLVLWGSCSGSTVAGKLQTSQLEMFSYSPLGGGIAGF